jgi:hypothetical protein
MQLFLEIQQLFDKQETVVPPSLPTSDKVIPEATVTDQEIPESPDDIHLTGLGIAR